MSYYFSATKVEVKETYPLFIETVPYDARIQIMNIMPKYQMGIELKPGDYDIRISKKGYETQRFMIKMKYENVIIKRELQKIKKRKVYWQFKLWERRLSRPQTIDSWPDQV